MAMLISINVQFYFLDYIHRNLLPFENVVLSGNGKLYKKTYFYYHENDIIIHIMKIYTINYFHFQYLVPITKRTVSIHSNIDVLVGLLPMVSHYCA